jgi:hypothetical protein
MNFGSRFVRMRFMKQVPQSDSQWAHPLVPTPIHQAIFFKIKKNKAYTSGESNPVPPVIRHIFALYRMAACSKHHRCVLLLIRICSSLDDILQWVCGYEFYEGDSGSSHFLPHWHNQVSSSTLLQHSKPPRILFFFFWKKAQTGVVHQRGLESHTTCFKFSRYLRTRWRLFRSSNTTGASHAFLPILLYACIHMLTS